MQILEYSEIAPEVADAEDAAGKLLYGAGNICNHYLSLNFVQRVVQDLFQYYHLAKKRIPQWDPLSRQTVTPEAPNGYKFELFIFDIFPLAERWAVMEVLREDEFAPVKNAPGSNSDTPEAAVQMLSEQAQRWLQVVGLLKTTGNGTLEILPALSYAGEGLGAWKGATVSLPRTLGPADAAGVA
jgi:UDP-N-acetylglucosamine/UDP-N-acetylgalactosamine diphosphorylase